MREARKNFYSKYFSIDKNKIFFFDHHECHAYYGFYGKGLTKLKNLRCNP